MRKCYGFGHIWEHGDDERFKEFIENDQACIFASLDKDTPSKIANRQRHRDIIKRIKEGDIVYLKKFSIPDQNFKIQAVGIVFKEWYKDEDLFCVGVKYNEKNYNINGIVDDIPVTDGVQRNQRIYEETNPDIIHLIEKLLKDFNNK